MASTWVMAPDGVPVELGLTDAWSGLADAWSGLALVGVGAVGDAPDVGDEVLAVGGAEVSPGPLAPGAGAAQAVTSRTSTVATEATRVRLLLTGRRPSPGTQPSGDQYGSRPAPARTRSSSGALSATGSRGPNRPPRAAGSSGVLKTITQDASRFGSATSKGWSVAADRSHPCSTSSLFAT